jgi:multidrug efflux pump subunit AcrB
MKNSADRGLGFLAARPIIANVLVVWIVLTGLVAFSYTKKEVFPAFSNDTIEIDTQYIGATPLEMEQQIIMPIENALNGITGIKTIRATAENNQARVIVELYHGEDIRALRQRIQDAVSRVEVFPEDADQPIVTQNINKVQVLQIILYGAHANADALKYHIDTLYTQLQSNRAIGPVEIENRRSRAIYVDLPQSLLHKYHLSLHDVAQRIRSYAKSETAGIVKHEEGDIALRFEQRPESAALYRHVPIVPNDKGQSVTLGSLAHIYEGYVEDNSDLTYNGYPAAAINVYRVGDLTPAGISEAVRKTLSAFQTTIDLAGLQTVVVEDRSRIFQQRADLLLGNGVVGLILVLALLGIFLDVRLAFWVGVGIPISFCGAFILFPATDISINMVTMFAFIMCLGIVVDDAIIVGENIYIYRQAGMKPLAASIAGVREVALPVTFSVLTNIIAFLPLFFVPGVMGKIFIYIPAVVVSVFVVSLCESLWVLPAHLASVRQLTPIHVGSFSAHVQALREVCGDYYTAALSWSLRYRYVVFTSAVTILLLCLAAVFGGRMGLELFPDVEADIASATAVLPPGATPTQLAAVASRIEAGLHQMQNALDDPTVVTGVYTIMEHHTVKTKMILVDAATRDITTRQLVQSWQRAVGDIPGIDSLVFSVNDRGPGAGPDLAIQLSHHDLATLHQASTSLAKHLQRYPLLSGVEDGIPKGRRQWSFTLNEKAHALGLTTQYILAQVKAGFYGVEALTQHRGRDEVEVIVRLAIADRDSLHDIENFLFYTPTGTEVRLGDVVTVDDGYTDASIQRQDQRRVLTVTAEAYPKSALVEVKHDLDTTIFPALRAAYPEITIGYSGKQEDISLSMQSLAVGLLLAVLMMYALLTVLFNSVSKPAIILAIIPFSFIGVVLGHYLLGYALSVLSLFGVVALTGVVINNGVVMMQFIQNNLATMPIAEAIVEAAKRRAFPVFLTSVTTFFGLLPIILERSMQAKFLIPMAVSLACGVLFSLVVTLVLLPVMCQIIADRSEG